MVFNIFPTLNVKRVQIADFNSKGCFIYGHKSHIVLMLLTSTTPQVLMKRECHTYIIAVRFNKFINSLLATLGEEGSLKIWEYELGPPELTYAVEGLKGPTAIEWSSTHANEIFVSSDCGLISKVHIDEVPTKDDIYSDSTDGRITIMASDLNYLAAGFEKGAIILLNMHNFELYKKLQAYNKEVVDISWSLNNQFLSYSMDGNLHIWTVQNDNIDGNVCHKWNSECWPAAIWHPLKPNFIIVSTDSGLIGEIDISDGGNKEIETYTNHLKENNKEIFNIVSNKFYTNIILTFSKDRMLTLWDLNRQSSADQYFTIVKPIRSISFPPFKLALSSIMCIVDGGAHLLFANISTGRVFEFFKNLSSSVTCISWHPEIENVLAFGTEKGKVAFLRKAASKHSDSTYYPMDHSARVSCISWGPCKKLSGPNSKTTELYPYSVADGAIHVHSPKKSANFRELVSNKYKKHFTCISWKDDYTLCAIGTAYSVLEFYNGDTLDLLLEIPVQKFSITYLTWHPSHILQNLEPVSSRLHNWIAVVVGKCSANQYPSIVLFELDIVKENDKLQVVIKRRKNISNIYYDVVTVTWNPHAEEQLAIAGYDRTIMIFDIVKWTPVLHYKEHFWHASGIAFYPLDKDIAYSAGGDCCIKCWKLSEQNLSYRLSKASRCALEELEFKEKQIEANNKKEKEVVSSCAIPSIITNSDMSDKADDREVIDKKENGNDKKEENKKNVEQDSQQTNSADVEKTEVKTATNFMTLQVTNITLQQKLHALKKYLKMLKNLDACEDNEFQFLEWLLPNNKKINIKTMDKDLQTNIHFAAIWNQQSLPELAKLRIETETMSEEVISMLCLYDRDLWKKSIIPYARQLIKLNLKLRAACFFYAGSDIDSLLNILKDVNPIFALAWTKMFFYGRSFHKALAIDTLLQLEKEDVPFLIELLRKTMNCSAKTFRTPEYLRNAARICFNAGQLEEAKYYAMQCLKQSLIKFDWETVHSMMLEQPYMKKYYIVFNIQKSLVTTANDLFSMDISKYGVQKSNTCDETFLWKSFLVLNQSYLSHLLHLLDMDVVADISLDLSALCDTSVSSLGEIYLFMAVEICKFYISLHSSNDEKFYDAFKHLNNILDLDYQYNKCLENILYCLFFSFDISQNGQLIVHLPDKMPKNIVDHSYVFLKEQYEMKNVFEILQNGDSVQDFSVCDSVDSLFQKFIKHFHESKISLSN